MKILIIRLTSGLLYCTAGCCIFVILLNRLVMLIPSGRAKTLAILAAFAVFVVFGTAAGLIWCRRPWVFIPLAVLCLVLLGEARQVWIRRSCAGTRPVGTIPHGVEITKPMTTTDLVVHRYEIPHPKWRGAPLRIVHLTDLHVYAGLPLEYYQEAVATAERAGADIAVLTGDLSARGASLDRLRKVLRPIARLENYAVLGNHDYWANPDAIGEAVVESGLHLLSNESASLTVGENEVVVTGYDYPWGTKDKTVPPQASGRLHIVLSHTPDNIYRLSRSSVDIVFSGHTHAGQIRVPFLGAIVVPSAYGRRFDHGHFIVKGTHLFVSSGIGTVHRPGRIYCRPDIFVVDIMPAQRQSGTEH